MSHYSFLYIFFVVLVVPVFFYRDYVVHSCMYSSSYKCVDMESHLRTYPNVGTLLVSNVNSSNPPLVVLQCADLSDDLMSTLSEFQTFNITVYVVISNGTFLDSSALWESSHTTTARLVRCSPELCSHMVYSLIAYEGFDTVAIIQAGNLSSADLKKALTAVILTKSYSSDSVGIFSCSTVRKLISDPCFTVEYTSFDVISRIRDFENFGSSSCFHREELNKMAAVVLTAFKRNYFSHVLTSLCTQTLTPKLIIFIQNMAFVSINRDLIPFQCHDKPILFQHVWLSNWNSFSYMRHFIPIPSSIHSTVLVDDDMVLTPTTLEMGISTMQQNHCIATERGKLIVPSVNHREWQMKTSSTVSNLTVVDYAFIPQFVDTTWRKAYWKVPLFSRRYGDILFMSSALNMELGIEACIIPQFSFFVKDEGDDSLSTSKSHSDEYNYLYSQIAEEWIQKGYKPVIQRHCHVCF